MDSHHEQAWHDVSPLTSPSPKISLDNKEPKPNDSTCTPGPTHVCFRFGLTAVLLAVPPRDLRHNHFSGTLPRAWANMIGLSVL